MSYQANFKRYELKYLMTRQQKYRLLQAMQPYMALDRYGRSVIRNLYYDTETFRLVRSSIEKPIYKEKLRVRSYGKPGPHDEVFVELKKKYDGVVYKRRIAMTQDEATDFIGGDAVSAAPCQIREEIDYFCRHYETLRPAVFLSYEREAYYSKDNSDLRVTFDENILARRQELTLGAGIWGTPLLGKGEVLMEIKTSGGFPLWMTEFLSCERVYKTSFSKYGEAYIDLVLHHKDERGLLYA